MSDTSSPFLAGAFALVVLLPLPVLAEPPTATTYETPPPAPGVHLHDGFFARFAIGISHVRLWRAARPSADFGGNVEESLSGGAMSLVYAIGGTPAPGFVVGGASFTHMGIAAPSSHGLRLDGRAERPYAYGSLAAVMLGPFVDYYPDPAGGWHLVGTMGFGGVGIGAGRRRGWDDDPNDWAPVPLEEVESHGVLGGGLSVGGGYEFWAAKQLSLGAILEVGTIVAPFSNRASDRERWSGVAFVGPSFTFNITYH